MLIHYKVNYSISFKIISTALVCLFFIGDFAWALSPRSQLAEPEFLQKFALGQFQLSMEGVIHYVDEQVKRERDEKVFGKRWAWHRTETININNTHLGGRLYGRVRGLEQVVFIKLSDFLASTGQLAWVDLTGETQAAKEFGGLPVIFIDSMYCNVPDKCVQRHEVDEVLQWEYFRVNVLRIATMRGMGSWIRKHLDIADPELDETEYKGMTSRQISELFCGYSYPVRELYKKIAKEVYANDLDRKLYFDLAHINKMLQMYPAESAKGVNIAARGVRNPDDSVSGFVLPPDKAKNRKKEERFQKIRRRQTKNEYNKKYDDEEAPSNDAGAKNRVFKLLRPEIGEVIIAENDDYLPSRALTAFTANAIGDDLSGQESLDLGAGIGTLGLIMWKRGASRVVLTDIKPQAVNRARDNAIRLGYKEGDVSRLEFICSNLFSGLSGRRFNLVLFTPSPIDGWDILVGGGYRYRYREHVGSFFKDVGEHLAPSARIIFRHTMFPGDPKSVECSRQIERMVKAFAGKEDCSLKKIGPYRRLVKSRSWSKKGEGCCLYVKERTYIYVIKKRVSRNALVKTTDRITDEVTAQNMPDIGSLRKMLYRIAEEEKQNERKSMTGGEAELKYYTVTYSENKIRKDSPAGKLLEYYVETILPMWLHGKDRVKLKSSNSRDKGIIWVESYSDRGRTKIIGEGHVDIAEDISGKALRLIGMLNMAFLASQIPSDLLPDRRSEYEDIRAMIENQIGDISEEHYGPDSLQFTPQGIWIRLPHAARVPIEKVDEYYRLTIAQLEQSA
ncbi:MAG: methyltransferase [Candidatus Omnitrophota bacterium]|nr:methyltransferase [Candidatus Omnitrophota bacterium]